MKAVVEPLSEIEERARKDNITLLKEKFERRLSEEIEKVRVEIAKKIAETKTFFAGCLFSGLDRIGVLTAILFAFSSRSLLLN